MTKNHLLLCCFALFAFTACKKTLPDAPLPVSSTRVNYPPGYNANIISSRQLLITFNNVVNDVVPDKNDNNKVFLIGSFSTANQTSNRGIVNYSSSNKSVTAYSLSNISNWNIKSFCQNGSNDYIGGTWLDNGDFNYHFIGYKTSNSSTPLYNFTLNGSVNTMALDGSSIAMAGDFYIMNNSFYLSPLILTNGSSYSIVGSTEYTNRNVTRMVKYNNAWIMNTNYFTNNISASGSSLNYYFGNALNSVVYDLGVFNGTLYSAGAMTSTYYQNISLNYVSYFDGSSWRKAGTNNLPGPCKDLEYHNGTLYACGIYSNANTGYIYYLETADNSWRTFVKSSVQPTSPTKIIFINNKLHVVDGLTFYLYE